MPQGGGNAEKIVICNQGGVQGAWFFEKDGGASWLNWNGSAWDTWQDFDANYGWHMSGDVFDIGGTLYCLNATMQGHHLYKYENGEWNYDGDIHENGYYQFHDAQFFQAENGDRDVGWFLVSTWGWAERADQDFGIWLVTNGNISTAARIDGTEGNTYSKIYRDPVHLRTFYTWGNYTPSGGSLEFGFWKFVVTGNSGFFDVTRPTSSDFNMTGSGYALLDIAGFYQYLDNTTVRQYILAQTTHSGNATWDVWYRYGTGGSLPTTSWSIKWTNVTATARNPQSIAAHKKTDPSTEHMIYAYDQFNGLAIHDTENGATTIKTVDDDTGTNLGYPPFAYTHYITRTDWSTIANRDQIIINTPHGGNVFAQVDPVNRVIDELTMEDQFSSSSGSDKVHGDVRSIYCDEDNDDVYMAGWYVGLYKAHYNVPSDPISLNEIGTANTNDPPHFKADFNFAWNCIVASPFASDIFYLGAAKTGPYYFDKSTGTSYNHTGLWTLDVDAGATGTIQLVDPGGASKSVDRLLADYSQSQVGNPGICCQASSTHPAR